MKLFSGLLIGSAFSAESFPRTPSSVCEVDRVMGKSCAAIRSSNSNAKSGVYKIQPGTKPVVVDCVFEDSTSFTVIQKRTTGNLSFNRNWQEYKDGFTSWPDVPGKSEYSHRGPRPDEESQKSGCILEEYWIGLDNIYALSKTLKQDTLRIDLERYNGQVGIVSYDKFDMSGPGYNYRLNGLGDFTNDKRFNVGNSFDGSGFGQQGYSPRDKYNTNHIGMEFSTSDNDHDKYRGNCGREDASGWWFNRCSAVNLNGKHYGMGSSAKFAPNQYGFDDGMLWQTWTSDKFESLTGSKMMLGQTYQNEDPTPLPAAARNCDEIAIQLNAEGRFTQSTKDGAFDGTYKIKGPGGVGEQDAQCKFVMCQNQPVGWTLIQNRYDGSVDFNRNWNEYKSGFGFEHGSTSTYGPRPQTLGEGWLGNDMIHALTEGADPRGVSLFIEMERRFEKEPNAAMVGYDRFSIGNERDDYVLKHIDGFTSLYGPAGDAFLGDDFGKQGFGNDQADTNHKGMKFSTKDRDNDNIDEFHCGAEDRSGWWFNACSAANLNGHYYSAGFVDRNDGRKPGKGLKPYDDGILWNTWTHDKWESLMTTRMWISPPGKLQQCRNNPAFDGSVYSTEPIDDIDEYDYKESDSDSFSDSFSRSYSNSGSGRTDKSD